MEHAAGQDVLAPQCIWEPPVVCDKDQMLSIFRFENYKEFKEKKKDFT